MIKNRLTILLLVMGLSCSASASLSFAQETAPAASLGWTSSLSEIQQETDQLLLINDQLAQERDRLSAEMASLQKKVVQQRDMNQKNLLALEERRSGSGPLGNASDLKSRIAEKERALERKKADLLRLKARDKNVDERMAVRKLKSAGLELEKKALLLDRKVKQEVAAGKAKTELQQLQDKVVSQIEQEKYIRTKIDALKRKAPPYIDDAKAELEEAGRLKQELAGLESKQQALRQEQVVVSEKRALLEKNKVVGKALSLNDRRDTLRTELEALKEKQEKSQITLQVKEGEADGDKGVFSMDEMKAMEAENKRINAEISNLHENIAVLEYQLTSIERYRMETKR